jgi:Outer membrane protein beta-barrel domain
MDPMFRSIARRVATLLFALFAVAPTLHAQSDGRPDREAPGRQASFTAGASFGDGETALALSAGLGVRLSPRLGIGFELAYARKLDFTLDLCPAPLVCVLGGRLPVTGRTVSLVPHLVVELPPVSGRLRTYLQAGVGAGHVRQRHLSGPRLTGMAEPVELTRSSKTLALSFGGGATFLISRRLKVGADVRALHLFDQTATADRFIEPSGTLRTVRVGSRVSWQF